MGSWRGDLKGVEPRFRIRPSAGAFAGREFTWDAKQYCANVAYAAICFLIAVRSFNDEKVLFRT